MNRRTVSFIVISVLFGGVLGAGLSRWHLFPETLRSKTKPPAQIQSRTILYWRNPMNPSIHSDHPMKDNMGMDYVPVYGGSSGRTKTSGRTILYWRNPMNPAIHSDHPMKDNMGMDYVPVYPPRSGFPENGISVDPRIRQTLGIRIVPVERRTFSRTLRDAATVTLDKHRIRTISPRFSGWIRTLSVQAPGDTIRRGDILANVYSPELASTEEDALIALTATRSDPSSRDDRELLAAARERLLLLGVPESEIERLEKTGKPRTVVPVASPYSGVALSVPVKIGDAIKPGDPLMALADLSRVWVNVAVYPDQLNWIRPGERVLLRTSANPSRTYRGVLRFVNPELNRKSRTFRGRVLVDNPDGFLRPGMYLSAEIHPAPRPGVLVIPRGALIRDGKKTIVIQETGHGHFRPVRITVGVRSDRWVEALSGLREGDRVVVSGQFLLDSESQLENIAARMEGGQP